MEEKQLRKENLNQRFNIYYYILCNILFLRLCNKNGKYKANNVNKDFSIRVVTDAKERSKGGNCQIRCTKEGNPKPTTTPPTTGMESICISYI